MSPQLNSSEIDLDRFALELKVQASEIVDLTERLEFLKTEIKKLPPELHMLVQIILIEGRSIGDLMPEKPSVPNWYGLASIAFGAVTLLFLMAIVWLRGFGEQELNETGLLALRLVISLTSALTFNFVGGKASAEGKIPIPFAKQAPIQFGIFGGFAVFIVVFLLTGNV